MELPIEVLVHNELLGMKGTRATLLARDGRAYELNCRFGSKTHRVLLPVAGTVLIVREPEAEFEIEEIER